MKKKNLILILSGALLLLSIISSFVEKNIGQIIGIIMLTLSIIILIVNINYIKEFKSNYQSKPNGSGLITFGTIFNIVCGILLRSFNSIGTLFILVGALITFFKK